MAISEKKKKKYTDDFNEWRKNNVQSPPKITFTVNKDKQKDTANTKNENTTKNKQTTQGKQLQKNVQQYNQELADKKTEQVIATAAQKYQQKKSTEQFNHTVCEKSHLSNRQHGEAGHGPEIDAGGR